MQLPYPEELLGVAVLFVVCLELRCFFASCCLFKGLLGDQHPKTTDQLRFGPVVLRAFGFAVLQMYGLGSSSWGFQAQEGHLGCSQGCKLKDFAGFGFWVSVLVAFGT